MQLTNKVAIVTGAGAGMGRAVALRYAREGAQVVLADINPVLGRETLDLLQQAGGRGLFVPTDVAQEQAVQHLVEAALAQFGRVDVLYSNAAVQFHGLDARAHELDTAVWDQTMNTNFRSAFLCAKYVIRAMLPTGGGSIIQVGSPTGLYGCAPGYTAYSAAKGGVHALTRVLAADYGRDGIRVNTLIPGTMQTPMTAGILADPQRNQALAQATMLGRLGQADEVTGLAVYLASDESSYCTGAFFTADGGLTAI